MDAPARIYALAHAERLRIPGFSSLKALLVRLLSILSAFFLRMIGGRGNEALQPITSEFWPNRLFHIY